ncbi:MAG: metallophosphoesterase [bacterium]|nr:metallophosphoesterase [bacterium]
MKKRSVCFAGVLLITFCVAVSAQESPYIVMGTDNCVTIQFQSLHAYSGISLEYWLDTEGGGFSGRIAQVECSMDRARTEEGDLFKYRVNLCDLAPASRYAYLFSDTEPNGSRTNVTETFSLRTCPSFAAVTGSLRFAVYGDTRNDTGKSQEEQEEQDRHLRNILGQVIALDPQPVFAVHSGDFVQFGADHELWRDFLGIIADADPKRSLHGNVALCPVMGNHEYYGINYQGGQTDTALALFFWNFGYPGGDGYNIRTESYDYCVETGPLSLIVLEGCWDNRQEGWRGLYQPAPGQADWLKRTLAACRAQNRVPFVSIHPGAFSSGAHGSPTDHLGGYDFRQFHALYEAYNIPAVFSGHDHLFEHLLVTRKTESSSMAKTVNPVRYFVIGADTFPRDRARGWTDWIDDDPNYNCTDDLFFNDAHCFLLVDVMWEPAGNSLTMYTIEYSLMREDAAVPVGQWASQVLLPEAVE